MNEDYSICSLMPKVDYSKKLNEIQKIARDNDLTDQQKYILIKETVSQPMSGEPLRLS